MKQSPNRKHIKEDIKKVLETDKDVLFAYLFGSQAAELTHFLSDIDVACYLKPGDMKYYLKKDKQLLGDLAVRLGTSKVDLILLNVAPLVLKFRAISGGEVILSQDEQERVDFETAVLYRYFDLKPYLDEYYKLIRYRIKQAV